MYAYDSFRQARWYRKGRLRPIKLIVVHCTVSKEMGTGAEAVARYFATTDRQGSTHAIADSDSVVGCVRDSDTAFGAANANADGLHLELVGMPDQTAAEWLDAFGRAMFTRAGDLIRYWAATYGIAVDRFLTVGELRAGRGGLTTHVDVDKAWPSTGHWDPGPWFPRREFLAAITPPAPPVPPPIPGDLMQLEPLNVERCSAIAEDWYQRFLGRSAVPADVRYVTDLLTDPGKSFNQAYDEWHATAAQDPAYRG